MNTDERIREVLAQQPMVQAQFRYLAEQARRLEAVATEAQEFLDTLERFHQIEPSTVMWHWSNGLREALAALKALEEV